MLLKDIAQELLTDFTAKKDKGPFYKIHYHIWKNICDAFDGKRKNCWVGSLSPFELPPMFDDMMNLPVELIISNTAHFGKNYGLIDAGSEALECREICSCLRGVTGGIASGQYPKPDLLLRSTQFCHGGDKTFDLAVEKYKVPYYMVNIPENDIPGALDYVARQIEDTFHKMEEYFDIKVTQSTIEAIFENVNKTYANFNEIGKLMRHRPSPAIEEDYWSAWMYSFIMGSKEAVEISQDTIDKIKDNIANKNFPVPTEKYRILLQGWAWIDNPIIDWIRAHENVSVIWNINEYCHPSGFSSIKEPLDPKDPFKSLAHRMLQHAMVTRREPELLQEGMYHFCKGNQIDGIISTGPWACMLGMGTDPSIKTFFSRKKFPYIEMNMENYDKRGFNEERARKDVELFLSTIMKKDKG